LWRFWLPPPGRCNGRSIGSVLGRLVIRKQPLSPTPNLPASKNPPPQRGATKPRNRAPPPNPGRSNRRGQPPPAPQRGVRRRRAPRRGAPAAGEDLQEPAPHHHRLRLVGRGGAAAGGCFVMCVCSFWSVLVCLGPVWSGMLQPGLAGLGWAWLLAATASKTTSEAACKLPQTTAPKSLQNPLQAPPPQKAGGGDPRALRRLCRPHQFRLHGNLHHRRGARRGVAGPGRQLPLQLPGRQEPHPAKGGRAERPEPPCRAPLGLSAVQQGLAAAS
jgi:hypothetical protein